MKYLVLAEKPDQASDYAHALGQPKKVKGEWQIYSDILQAEVIVTYAVGHLIELSNPYKDYENWDLKNLPAFPDKFQYEVMKDSKQRFNAIKAAIKESDVIIIGTDPDRQGEAIAYRILEKIPGALKKVKYRLWCNSLTPQGIQWAFRSLREATETRAYTEEAEALAVSDWLVGFNMSPWVTLKMRDQGLLEKYDEVMTVGRVQTAVVSLVVENDDAIETFESEPYWKIQAKTEDDVLFTNDVKYMDYEAAQKALSELTGQGLIKSLTQENKRKNSPKLFNLTQLQTLMSQKYQIDAKETLRIAQALYQKKFLSYPRTSSSLITEDEFAYLKSHAVQYQKALDLDFDLVNLIPRKAYVNSDKVLEHYALIPTETIPDLKLLSREERLVYQEVTQRTLLMFAADYLYQSTQVELACQDMTFKAQGNVTLDMGWRQWTEAEISDQVLPAYEEGQIIEITPFIKVDKTKPPTRLTEASLLDKVLPKYKLGTPATRADILETIKQRKYITYNKKNGQLKPTERGRLLVYWMAERSIMYINPEMTAKWEEFLVEIGQGQRSKESFIDQTKKAIIAQMQKG